VDALSAPIPSLTNQLGQIKFAPELTVGFNLGDANKYEATIAPELICNFTSTSVNGLGNLDPTTIGPQGMRGAIKWDVAMCTRSGISLSTQGSYDGMGTPGYSATTGSLRVTMPLNWGQGRQRRSRSRFWLQCPGHPPNNRSLSVEKRNSITVVALGNSYCRSSSLIDSTLTVAESPNTRRNKTHSRAMQMVQSRNRTSHANIVLIP